MLCMPTKVMSARLPLELYKRLDALLTKENIDFGNWVTREFEAYEAGADLASSIQDLEGKKRGLEEELRKIRDSLEVEVRGLEEVKRKKAVIEEELKRLEGERSEAIKSINITAEKTLATIESHAKEAEKTFGDLVRREGQRFEAGVQKRLSDVNKAVRELKNAGAEGARGIRKTIEECGRDYQETINLIKTATEDDLGALFGSLRKRIQELLTLEKQIAQERVNYEGVLRILSGEDGAVLDIVRCLEILQKWALRHSDVLISEEGHFPDHQKSYVSRLLVLCKVPFFDILDLQIRSLKFYLENTAKTLESQ